MAIHVWTSDPLPSGPSVVVRILVDHTASKRREMKTVPVKQGIFDGDSADIAIPLLAARKLYKQAVTGASDQRRGILLSRFTYSGYAGLRVTYIPMNMRNQAFCARGSIHPFVVIKMALVTPPVSDLCPI